MEIEAKLKSYMEKKSRIEVLDIKIIKAKEEIRQCNNEYQEPEEETIEAMQMSAVVINPDKPGPTNKLSSATENTALNYDTELSHTNDVDTLEVKRDIRTWEREKRDLEGEIKTIEAALRSLTKEEEYIIKCFYMQKMYWSSITSNYPLNFNLFKSEPTLKRIKKEAEEKLLRIVS